MFRRKGMTLVEVLIAIFVMGIGLLSVLAMFPLGSVSMARAIKDDRAGHAAANAKAIAIAQNIRFDPVITALFNNNVPTALVDVPSIAVYADPVGYLSYSSGSHSDAWIAGNVGGINRSYLSFTTNATTMLKWCVLLDDITFGISGTPVLSSGFVDRGGGVSWAWMLQRPKARNPSCCNMTVVVYNQRPISAAKLLSGREVAYTGTPIPNNQNQVMLNWNAGTPAPQVKEGGWVLDATANGSLVTFYRVTAVGDVAGNSVLIETDQPLQGTSAVRSIVIMEGVVEVIDCGPGWKSWSN
jgi:prepilin-type N-terminal cleavage/methylation domain-containing protein